MVSFWTSNSDPEQYNKARHKAIVAIIHAFTQNNIYTINISGQPATQAPELAGPQKG